MVGDERANQQQGLSVDRFSVATKYWHLLDDGRVQCDVCPRACKLRDGQRGVCFVRGRQGDGVVSTTYGRSSGFCVDPVEKKPLNHFLPGSSIFSFGTAGCNLACRFCQNWDISKSKEIDTLADAASPEAIARTAVELGCRSVAFTYNDPTIFLEYAIDVADACRERGLAAVAVTAGYICSAPRAELYSHLDAANVDLKGFTEDFYRHTCGGELAAVLDTLEYLHHETDVWLELTTLLIPGLNDSDAEVDAMTAWVVEHLGPDVPMHFTAFHPDYRMLDRPPTPPATLTRARRIAIGNGVRHAYTGNVHDGAGQSTYCHACGRRVIERDWYAIGEYRLDDAGHCAGCGAKAPGRFDGPAGGWGPNAAPGRDEPAPHRVGPMTGPGRTVRPAAVAGTFYPADPTALRASIADSFAGAVAPPGSPTVPKALVVPHAGFQYSGAVAASAYLRLAPGRETIRHVVLLGPSHRVYLRGLGLSTAVGWATPLGVVPVDGDAAAALGPLAGSVRFDDRAHAPEHSLEVQLPFLQTVLYDFTLVPIVVGDATVDEVAAVLDALWAGPETVIAVSTDLSHYHRYDDAVDIDSRTVAAIAALRPADIADVQACGARPLRGLLHTAAQRHLRVETIDVRNSGDTAGDRQRVVGYGAFALA